jgi:hypothetical protein
MAISTDRATIEERAAAWDYLMNSTETGSAAITKAWCWLRDQVEAREAATAVQLRVVEVDDRELGHAPEDDARS